MTLNEFASIANEKKNLMEIHYTYFANEILCEKLNEIIRLNVLLYFFNVIKYYNNIQILKLSIN